MRRQKAFSLMYVLASPNDSTTHSTSLGPRQGSVHLANPSSITDTCVVQGFVCPGMKRSFVNGTWIYTPEEDPFPRFTFLSSLLSPMSLLFLQHSPTVTQVRL